MAKTYIEWMSCKTVNGQFGEFYNISLNYDKLKQYVNDKGYINITMSKRKEVWQYGDTHTFTLNEWKPENGWQQQKSSWNNTSDDEISVSDIPF